MGIIEKRKSARVSTINLISYAGMGEDGKTLDQGMGKALDIGQGGILMETPVPIQAQYILLTSMNVDEELIKVKGRVVHCREIERGVFHTGIRFNESSEKVREVVAEMIRAFLKTKAE